jgi:hypothetical protein
LTNSVTSRLLVAQVDDDLRAVLGPGRALRFNDLAVDAADDLASYVRAASAVRRLGARLMVVQDDVNALATIDATGAVTPLLLPVGHEGRRRFDSERGNKRYKWDLEACVVLPDGRLIALGSGSSRERERLVLVAPDGAVRVHEGSAAYDGLRRVTDAMEVELNLEGAVVRGDRLRLFQRGNGWTPDGSTANAVIDWRLSDFLDWIDRAGPPPRPAEVVRVDLGSLGGTPFGFTDATVTAQGRLAFVACAEESADVRSDGPVLGCCFGWLDDDAVSVVPVVESDGRATPLKLEGLEARPDAGSLVFDVVADMDSPRMPALLCELRLESTKDPRVQR